MGPPDTENGGSMYDPFTGVEQFIFPEASGGNAVNPFVPVYTGDWYDPPESPVYAEPVTPAYSGDWYKPPADQAVEGTAYTDRLTEERRFAVGAIIAGTLLAILVVYHVASSK